MFDKRRKLPQDRQLSECSIEYGRAHMPSEPRLEKETVRLRHVQVGRSGQRTGCGVVGVVSYRRRGADTDRPIASQVN